MPPRILIITPWVPWPLTGACQQDRFNGLKQMQSLGYDIQVIARIHKFQNRSEIEHAFAKSGIPLILVPHLTRPWTQLVKNLPRAILSPAYLDGAALEYLEHGYQQLVLKAAREWKPDVIWIEYSSLWPVLRLLKPLGIPMIVKSSLNEPRNCIDEHGGSLLSRLKSLPKYPGERIATTESDMILAITPKEEQWYRKHGARKTGVLPLRGLSQCFRKRTHQHKDVLDVVFLSSNYNMGHNRDALLFLLKKIVPRVNSEMPGVFRFHVTGRKFPEYLRAGLPDNVHVTGFMDDLGGFLQTMDIALCPWITGQGMQQKVFEPLCRSLPLLTNHTAGYPFEDGKHLLLCTTPQEYVEGLRKLRDPDLRNALSQNAYDQSWKLFSEDAVKKVVSDAVESVRH